MMYSIKNIMNNRCFNVAIIGGGASGLMAAISAAMNGAAVVVFDKNKFLGRKLRITGKGRCNITNACDDASFFQNVTRNSKFLYSAYYNFNNEDVQNFFINNGLELKTERGGRVFPKSDNAKDVVSVFEKLIVQLDITVINKKVKTIKKNDFYYEVECVDNKTICSDTVIIATGGVSYPLTGSTGDGYKLAELFGHTVTRLKASLVPIEAEEDYCSEMQGLSLKNVQLSLYKENACVYKDFGEMMFTHFGITGPIVLSASSHIKDGEKYKILIDLKPALDADVLDKRLLRDFTQASNKNFSNSLERLLPKKLIPVIIRLSGILPDKKVNSITKEERLRLLNIIKAFPVSVKRLRPISEAIITSGGIETKEINPSSMESKLSENLFFSGEVIDVDAYTGGFNLQIAFSTGWLAGEKAAQKSLGGIL